ncbi:MAG TPA: glycoside hydrolase family 2 TIM barrel-domain containing protein [Candidatus Sulfotelmatobacter sp.]|nr:glycoside hydrolase family 2 TIM barrel-domain containing protein [Candidatus Sulfotelmatobacter sp.]
MRVSKQNTCTAAFALILFALSVSLSTSAAAQQRISLSGYWQRWIAGQLYDSVVVPSSYRPVGTATLVRNAEFSQLTSAQRLLLRFEGIAGNGKLRVNGHEMGVIAPYTPHIFDVTDVAKTGPNKIEMELVDWQAPLGLGPAAAWENSGGIIYDAYAEIRTDPYIENARLSYQLSPDFKTADCTLDVFVRSTGDQKVHIVADLQHQQVRVAHVEQDANVGSQNSTATLHWTLDTVDLWSPDHPALYQLSVKLASPRGDDTFGTDTGFRSLVVQGNKLVLNGKPLVLKGVARHGLWDKQGYTLSHEQIDQDFRMIKSMGANAVRLVHYPHAPYELEVAARDGILVTQESGLTWIDFTKAPPSTLQTGINILERVVRRDWNNPAFWAILLANESTPTLEVMKDARQRIKTLEPSILMSTPGPSAPDNTIASVRRLFDDANFDFYTAHPYTYEERHFAEVIKEFGAAKPIIFTEWGGPVGKLPRLMDREVHALGTLEQQGKLSGTFFWEWADMTQYMREDISMDGPTLAEGVVTADRTVRSEVFSRLSDLYRYDIGEPVPSLRSPILLSRPHLNANENSGYHGINLQSLAEQQAADWELVQAASLSFWKENSEDYVRKHGGDFYTWDAPALLVGPVPFQTAQIDGHTRPLVIRNGASLEVPVHAEADRLHFLGNVTTPDGYPTRGNPGEEMGSYTIYFSDGTKQEIPLRWGLEVARSNVVSSSTLLNPVALLASPVLKYTRDESYEDYRTFLYTVGLKRKTVDRIVITVKALPDRPLISMPNQTGSGYAAGETALLLYAITAERSETASGNAKAQK